MNTALNPPRVPKSTTSPSMLPTGNESMAEILAMMKQQGMDVSGFEAEAEDIWRHLTEMSDRDPDEYRKFISEQMEGMKDGAAAPSSSSSSKVPGFAPPGVSRPSAPSSSSSTSSSSAAAAEEEEKFFRPQPGFVIRTTTTSGDGIKVHISSTPLYLPPAAAPPLIAPIPPVQVRADGQGKPLYINFAQHVAIEPPFDAQFGSVLDLGRAHELRSADGLQVRVCPAWRVCSSDAPAGALNPTPPHPTHTPPQTLVNDVLGRIDAVGESQKEHAPGYPTLSLSTFPLYYAPVYRAMTTLWAAIVGQFEVRPVAMPGEGGGGGGRCLGGGEVWGRGGGADWGAVG